MWEKKLEFCEDAERGRLWEDIGRCFYQLGDCDEALQFAQMAYQVCPPTFLIEISSLILTEDAFVQHGVDFQDAARQMSAQYTIGHTLCKMSRVCWC